ncbi:glyoxalase/bleomycin resistance protein/dioxygenase [Rhizodiscina lignyota]|uniref:Glyoxalase/bleomycin resistance protein/dioxygenase n=1 Tax=Rhizodiscina lignyota TaxID=1504668 RepID=A0A9P4IBI7_9PEZI|nr:glyoxalase/bleomycin resistance protein/dioxygenase [Rhizodiscina lignyota]
MIDHAVVGTTPALFATTVKFYEKALAPLAYKKISEMPDKACGFGSAAPDFWVFANGQSDTPSHVALRAEDREAVSKFHEAAVEAGGKDNGEPGVRQHIHPNYFAAFVHDPAGNNVEVVCHNAE